jgi:ADP-ribose pyrophosphatase YjhB (NUDIX family)
LNAATAAGGIILNDEGRALLVRRAHEPGLGKLGLPGGFVDDGERVEETVCREVREEAHLEVENLRFFGSFPNRYEFRGSTYSVLDLIFLCDAVNADNARNSEEVSEILWLLPSEINLDEVAFPSVRRALELFIQKSK